MKFSTSFLSSNSIFILIKFNIPSISLYWISFLVIPKIFNCLIIVSNDNFPEIVDFIILNASDVFGIILSING